jgi:hypothetical protein
MGSMTGSQFAMSPDQANLYNQYIQQMGQNQSQMPTTGNAAGYPGYYGYNASANNPYMPAAVRNYGIPQYAGSGMYPNYGPTGSSGGGYGWFSPMGPAYGYTGSMNNMGGLNFLMDYFRYANQNASQGIYSAYDAQKQLADLYKKQYEDLQKANTSTATSTTGATGSTTGKTDVTPAPATDAEIANQKNINQYGGLLNSAYQQVFGHPADLPGAQYWAGQLAANKFKTGDIIPQIIGGAQQDTDDYTKGQAYKNSANYQNLFGTPATTAASTTPTATTTTSVAPTPVAQPTTPYDANYYQDHNAKGGRIQYSTGGKIPEMDAAFKHAKKYVDEHTKGLLDVHDDEIAHALHIAKGKL